MGLVDGANSDGVRVARRILLRIAVLELVAHRGGDDDAGIDQFGEDRRLRLRMVLAADAEVDDLDVGIERGRERLAVELEVEVLVVACALGIVEHLPAVQPAIGHACDADRIIDHGRDRAADMCAMAEKITLSVAVVPIVLDRVCEIGMPDVDTAIEHSDMNPPRTWPRSIEPSDGAKPPLPDLHGIGGGTEPPVGNGLDQIHRLRGTQALHDARIYLPVLHLHDLKSGQRLPRRRRCGRAMER